MVFIVILAAFSPFLLVFLMLWLLRDAPTNGSVRRGAHYTGRRRDGSIGQIRAGRGVKWE